MKVPHLLCFFLFGLAACQSPSGDLDAVAAETCACIQPLADHLEKTQNAITGTEDATAFQQMLTEELETILREGETCTGKLEEKYPEFAGEVTEEQEAALRAAVARQCPDVARMMEGATDE